MLLADELCDDPVSPIFGKLIQFRVGPILDRVRDENHCGVKAQSSALGGCGVNEFRRGDPDGGNATGL
jgi:hypothetical protein